VDKKSGVGLPDVIVKAFDMDRKYDDLLGSTVTNKDGYYQVEYTTKDFKDLFDKKPETYIEVLDQEGHTLYTSPKSFVLKSGKQEIVDAEVDGKKLAASLDRGKAIQAARKIDLGAIAGRSVALKGRLAIPRRALGKLRRGKTVEKDKLRQNVAPRTEVKTNVKPKTAAVSEVQPAKKTRETTPKKTAAKTKSSSATRSTPAGQKAKSKKKATIRAKSKSATKATAAKKKAKRKSTTRKER
jgi:hypothetical protein